MSLSPHRDRLEGFRKAMRESHIPVLEEYLISGSVQIEDGLSGGRQLLRLSTPPTAIMLSNNKLLLGLIQALDELHIPVPDQVSIVGFDDYLWNRYFSPSLTAIAQPTHAIGNRAFTLLLQIMNRNQNEELPVKNIRLDAELRVRNSTGPPRESLATPPVAI